MELQRARYPRFKSLGLVIQRIYYRYKGRQAKRAAQLIPLFKLFSGVCQIKMPNLAEKYRAPLRLSSLSEQERDIYDACQKASAICSEGVHAMCEDCFVHYCREQLIALDWGEVVSYGELGRATGRATAGRAVGGAVGANPVPIIVPCHRVLGGSGRITGYSGGEGVPTKAWLLAHEGIPHSVPRSGVA